MRSLAVPLACLALAALPCSIVAQQRKCDETKSPKRLPAPSALVDSARAIADLASFEKPPDGLVFSLLFYDGDSLPITRPLEGVEPRAALVLGRALRSQKPAGLWAVRVRVVGGVSPALTLARSVYCAPVLTGRPSLPFQSRIEIRPDDRMPTSHRTTRIVVEVLVAETGQVATVRLVPPSGIRELDDEITRTWQASRFLPALMDSVPMEAWYRSDWKLRRQ